MKQMTNARVMTALTPLIASKHATRPQLQYIRVINMYAYATDGYVYGRFAIDCLPDGFYKCDKDGIAGVDHTSFGYLCNIESIIPDREDVAYRFKSAKLVEALATLRKMPASERPGCVGIVVKNQVLSFELCHLHRTVKAMQAVHGTDFSIEIYGIGVMLFRAGDDIAMLIMCYTPPANPYLIELAD